MSPKHEDRGPQLVRERAPGNSNRPLYRVGDLIPTSGIYCAIHSGHRLAHDVTLISGDVFPHCKQCGDAVSFELVAAAPPAMRDQDFAVRIYEIPHPNGKSEAPSTAPHADPIPHRRPRHTGSPAPVHLVFGDFFADVIPDQREPGLFQYVVQRVGSPDVLALGATLNQDAAIALAERLMRELAAATPIVANR